MKSTIETLKEHRERLQLELARIHEQRIRLLAQIDLVNQMISDQGRQPKPKPKAPHKPVKRGELKAKGKDSPKKKGRPKKADVKINVMEFLLKAGTGGNLIDVDEASKTLAKAGAYDGNVVTARRVVGNMLYYHGKDRFVRVSQGVYKVREEESTTAGAAA